MATRIIDNNITVDFKRLPGSPKENITAHGTIVTRILQCEWEDRLTLAEELLGGSTIRPPTAGDWSNVATYNVGQVVKYGSEYYICVRDTTAGINPTNASYWAFYIGDSVIVRPHKYPDMEGVFAKDVNIEPLISVKQITGNYEKAILTVNYETLGYTPGTEEEDYVTESLHPATEFMTLTKEGIYWDAGKTEPLQELEVPTLAIKMIEWSYTKHKVRAMPSALLGAIGKVNKYAINSPSLGLRFPVETLLCANPSLEREMTQNGNQAWAVTYSFIYREHGWNYYPKNIGSGTNMVWSKIYDDNGAQIKPYEPTSFVGLL